MQKERMIEAVKEWICSCNEEKKIFLVDVRMSRSNDIVVEIEAEAGNISIEDCVSLNKFVESKFDRDVEDYSLEVGSAGIGQPFKVLKQYKISIGQNVEVSSKDGKKIVGVLTSVDEKGFKIQTRMKIKSEESKKPVMQDVEISYSHDEVNEVRLQIDFKSKK